MNTNTSCKGCYPIYQCNQMAHMDEGGCQYFSESFDSDNDDINIKIVEEKPIENENFECCICFDIIDKKKK